MGAVAPATQGFWNEVLSKRVSVAGGCMCLIAYLILGLIAGWFVASQAVGNSGASDFRPPPAQIFRRPYDSHPHPRQSPCPHGKRYIPHSVSPEILEPIRGQSRVNRRARDRTVSEPPLNRPSIVSSVRQRIGAGAAYADGLSVRDQGPDEPHVRSFWRRRPSSTSSHAG